MSSTWNKWQELDNKTKLQIIDKVSTKLTSMDLDEQYKDMLNDCYGTVKIAGYEYETAEALYMTDTVAYKCGLADYIGTNEQVFEAHFNDHLGDPDYWYLDCAEVEEILEEMGV